MVTRLRGIFENKNTEKIFPLAAFVALSFILYGNSLFGQFVYDDNFFTTRSDMRVASYLLRTWFEPSLPRLLAFPPYRPLTFFSFSLNFLVFGDNPFWFHAVSVAFNGIVCWLLFRVMIRLFHSRPLAWFTALLYAFFPIHTEAIAFVKSRDELLVAVFGLLAWLLFLRAADGRRRRILFSALAALSSLAAFLSKESAIVLPGVFVGTLFLLEGWGAIRRAWIPIAAQIIAMMAFYGLHGIVVGWKTVPDVEILFFGQNPLGFMGSEYVPWTAFELFFIAVAKTIVPWNLSAVYGYQHIPIINHPFGSWMAPAGVLTAVILIGLALWPRLRKSPLAVGALTFLVLYFPFSKIVIVKGIDFFAEHWLYAPSIGLAMIGGYALSAIIKHHRMAGACTAAVIALAYTFIILTRNTVWRNDVSLGQSMVRDAPDAVQSYAYYAKVAVDYDMQEQAIEAVTRGLAISRLHPPIHQVAAIVALREGRLDVAEQAVAAAEALYPEITTDVLRATILAKSGRFQESLDFIRASRWFYEDDRRIRLLLALDLWRLGRHEEAESYFDWDALEEPRMSREEKIRMIEAY